MRKKCFQYSQKALLAGKAGQCLKNIPALELIAPMQGNFVPVLKSELDAAGFQTARTDFVQIQNVPVYTNNVHSRTFKMWKTGRGNGLAGITAPTAAAAAAAAATASSTTTTTAAVTAAATTTATAATTAVTTTAATTGAFLARLRFIDRERAPVQFPAIERAHRRLESFGVCHGDKRKPLGSPGHAVCNQVDFSNGTNRREQVLKIILRGVKMQIPDE
jgi:hypothetical protein